MRDEGIVREWFGAIRAASDRALGELAEKQSLDANQKRKADLLLRQLLSDRIPALAVEAEGFADLRAEALRANVYSELIEDALAGTGAGPEDMAVAVFLSACSEGVGDEETFQNRLGDALGRGSEPDGEIVALAREIRSIAERRFSAFAARRRELRAPNPVRYVEGPPEGLDEFEYIDWQITH